MKKLFVMFCVCAAPIIVHAEITITEIAWMGTMNSQYEEWVELYNDGDEQSLSGWKLLKSGGTVLFSLTGTIPAEGYYLVCRTTGTLTNPLSGSCDEQGAFGGSGLNNTSDQVVLKDEGGAVINTADGTGGWPAGDSGSKQTMQWDGLGWITAAGTPGAETVGGSEDENIDHENEAEINSAEKKDIGEKIELIEPDPIYVAHMNIPDYGIADIAMPIRAEVTKDKALITKRGRFEWSMGDGTGFKFYRNTDIAHVFQYPGDYTVVLAYYSDVFRDEPDSVHRKKITIAPAAVAISDMTDDGGVILHNDSSRDIDLAKWKIVSNGQTFIFPNYTTIIKGGDLSISGKTLAIPISKSDVVLRNPNGDIVARYGTANKTFVGDAEFAGGAAAYAAAPDPNWSANSIDSKESEKTNVANLWDENKWYILFVILACAVAVAYFMMRLYASRNEVEKVEDLDYDIL